MVNQVKIFAVDDLKAKLAEAKSAALIDYQGLNSEQLNILRQRIKAVGGSLQIVKNSLVGRALKAVGIGLDQPLTGQNALVLAVEDEITPLKEINKAKKEWEKPEFRLGIYQGKILSLEALSIFVNLPAKEILFGQLIGSLTNPLYRLVYGLKYNQTKLVLALKEIEKSKKA
jgi:large subunit ribosomal protein L10